MLSNKLIATLLLSVAVSASLPANAAQDQIDDLMDVPLKDLMKMEVTSVSKKSEKATDAAAAIFVITQEDIKRSGATNIPEVLRIAPGIQVSRIDASRWAITSRGFAGEYNNKLLVLIDGRSVYNPLFSGVLWEEQGYPLEDIERIEVIRGPGSTLWGANAVNGVINIISKNSKDTQGTLLSAGAGSFEKFSGLGRHGGKLGENTTYRAYVQDYEHGNTEGFDHRGQDDDWRIARTGFRTDGKLDEASNFTLQGDLYQGKRNEQFDLLPSLTGPNFSPTFGLTSDSPDTHDMMGGNILGRFNKKLEDSSEVTLQAYYDYTQRQLDIFSQKINTFDFDAQHSFNLSKNHNILWGAGYRLISYQLENTTIARYSEEEEANNINIFSSFVQDKIQLVPDELFLTIGSKFEHNDYTGFEVQPNARLTWLAAPNQTVWAGVSRAVRTPSINERSLTQVIAAVPTGGVPPSAFVAITEDNSLDSEELIAYEVGYRIQPTDNTSFDITGFVNDYDKLRTFEASGPLAPDIGASFTTDNKASAKTAGVEIASNWDVTDRWNLAGSYTYLSMDVDLDSDSTDVLFAETDEDRSPDSMFNIRSHYKFTNDLQMNNALYYVSKLKADDVDSYYRFDTNIIWEATPGVELSLIGQNLLDNRHQEYRGATYNSASEIPRSVFGKVTLRF